MHLMLRAILRWDGGLATIVKVGDRVRHANTRQWGTVLEVHPHDEGNTCEIKVRREPTPDAMSFDGEGWWPSYFIDDHEAKK